MYLRNMSQYTLTPKLPEPVGVTMLTAYMLGYEKVIEIRLHLGCKNADLTAYLYRLKLRETDKTKPERSQRNLLLARVKLEKIKTNSERTPRNRTRGMG